MKISLNIPVEFCKHYFDDRFEDSLQRIKEDLKGMNFKGLSGNYELETIEMLIKAFKESERGVNK